MNQERRSENMNGKKNGKKLGVLGGMGSAASAEFLKILAQKAPAKNDQEQPIVYMIADSEIPDRSTAIIGKGKSPKEQIYKDLLQLCDMGADILAIPCNTAHYFVNSFGEQLPKPIIHIVEETVLAAKKKSPQGAWMLSTVGTAQSGLYQNCAKKHNLPIFIPNEEQRKLIQESIYKVKSNHIEEAGKIMKIVVHELWAQKDILIMAACTEIPLSYAAADLPKEKEVSSLDAIADACLKKLYS